MGRMNLHGYAADKPFVYSTYDHLFLFTCARQDLAGVITVTMPDEVFEQLRTEPLRAAQAIAKACVEMGSWHALEIREFLGGFRGYDCLEYRFQSETMEHNQRTAEQS